MPKENNIELREKAAALPSEPGVYQFINAAGEVIYVGKAKNLRKRVASYFVDSKDLPPKTRIMIRGARDVHHIVTPSESDALLLENNLIKNLQPRYNILLKDDKSYPWIVVRNEPFPRVESTRRMTRDGSRYWGPYSSLTVQKNVLELLHSIYRLRRCRTNLSAEHLARGKYRTCLQYHLGNCRAPCVGQQSEEQYGRDIEMIARTLSGDLRGARKYLEDAMRAAADALDFEEAARYKTRLALLDSYVGRSVVVSSTIGDLDVFALLKDIDTVYCNFVRIVGGAVVNSFTAQFSLGAEDDDRTILTQAIMQISERISGPLTHNVLVPYQPNAELFNGVRFSVPKRGEKLKLMEFALRNARLYRAERLKNLEIEDPARHTERILESLRRELRMTVLPRHIECFDNSNLHGTHPVASCVVFRDAKPSRSEYRHFNIKTVVGADDFVSMREIVGRRYRRILEEGTPLPDLIVIDGGKGQLGAAVAAIGELGIADRVAVIGLAKRLEEVYHPGDPEPYYLDRTGEPLKVIMHLRDEAHRFGLAFHRQKRSQAFIRTELESIAGIGSASVEKLLKRFKTVSAIRKVSVAELSEVVGAARAEAIIAHFLSFRTP
ncbi:MAG: excinuclease ABC subunit UvrC [Rikenellaceae bacterium]|nr:excinuclease ABC subunit UvrC [Rikenellaceae bacterium]MCL2693014.1 excinuclease ABC subunit UvrC [Rikenellaceae bacterium]